MVALRAQGKSPEEVKRFVADAFAKGVFQPPARPGVDYMLSMENVVPLDPDKGTVGHFPPRVMFLRSIPDQRQPRFTKPRLAGLRRWLRHAQCSDHRSRIRRGTGSAGTRTPLIVRRGKGGENCPPRRVSIVVGSLQQPNQGGLQ